MRDLLLIVGIAGATFAVATHLRRQRRQWHETRLWRLAAIAVAALSTLGAALIVASAPCAAADYAWPVVKVIDGDTVRVDASANMPPELASIAVRLRDVDTPEKGRWAKCEAEKQAAAASTNLTK